MGIIIKKLEAKCESCGEDLTCTSLKSMYLDDFLVHCENDSCNLYRDGASSLNSMSNAVARELDKLPDWGSDEV